MHNDRLLSFERLDNFRDYGGYDAAGGRVVRGRLYRSAQHSRLTHKDLAKLAEIDLRVVVDLRRRSERLEQPSRRPDNWQGVVLESDIGGDGDAPHIQFLKTQELTAVSGRDYMRKTYARMPFEPGHVALFQGYFEQLKRGNGPSLVHCAAGKDRTGFLAALTHHMLGVSEDDLMADYLATNAAVRLEERAEDIGAKLARYTGKPVPRSAVIAFLGVEPDFLQSGIKAIVSGCGSMEAYFESVLLLDRATCETIRQHLIV